MNKTMRNLLILVLTGAAAVLPVIAKDPNNFGVPEAIATIIPVLSGMVGLVLNQIESMSLSRGSNDG